MQNTNEEYDSKKCGEGVPFQRLRRITGYLVGDVSRWNNGKFAELKDRVKHDDNNKELEQHS